MPAFDFAGTTSLVNGASPGLGEQFARQLAARGSNLVLVARSADRLAALADELRASHRVAVTTVPADLSRTVEVSRVAAHAVATQVDVLVNNAGFGTYGAFAGLDPDREHAEVMVNAVAAGAPRVCGGVGIRPPCSRPVRPVRFSARAPLPRTFVLRCDDRP